MGFYSIAGKMALGSRLRRLGDVLMSDAEKIYPLYDVDIDPRWFPVFYMLTVKESASITELANDIGQTHPAVSQVVRSMLKNHVVETQKCSEDARVNKVTLTAKGRSIAEKLSPQCEDVDTAIGDIFSAADSHLWSELDAIEHEIEKQSVYERVQALHKTRERSHVQIVAYEPKYQNAFKDLNVEWIEQHWEMEPSDYKALDKPTENIIDKGGYIAVALYKQQPVGTCALIKMDDGSLELAKMAVSGPVKGIGIGYMLGMHVISKAREMGAKRIYLESNTVLVPAITLYRKLGFKKILGSESPYKRCNIQMELNL